MTPDTDKREWLGEWIYAIFVQNYEKLLEENKKLKEELEQYKKMFEDHLKECYIKNTAEFMDKKFTLENWFMEEDTLQELRDLGKI